MPADSATAPGRLRKRADFVAAAKGRRVSSGPFSLQCVHRPSNGGRARFGLTVTRKVGSAVERNRIRRRLRAALAQTTSRAASDTDYVIVARREALSVPFGKLVGDLDRAFVRIAAPREPSSGYGSARS